MYADELKISQVVYNLVNNAITYTGEDKVVPFAPDRTRRKSSDRGCATRARASSKISSKISGNAITRWTKPTSAAQIGTGLGLSIVKTILDMHGGAYGVQSEQGVGSTFWFELDVQGDSVVEAPKRPLKCLKINCAVFSFAICYNMKQQESPFWGNKAYNPYNLSLLYKLEF